VKRTLGRVSSPVILALRFAKSLAETENGTVLGRESLNVILASTQREDYLLGAAQRRTAGDGIRHDRERLGGLPKYYEREAA
jgi:hypothetical protein